MIAAEPLSRKMCGACRGVEWRAAVEARVRGGRSGGRTRERGGRFRNGATRDGGIPVGCAKPHGVSRGASMVRNEEGFLKP